MIKIRNYLKPMYWLCLESTNKIWLFEDGYTLRFLPLISKCRKLRCFTLKNNWYFFQKPKWIWLCWSRRFKRSLLKNLWYEQERDGKNGRIVTPSAFCFAKRNWHFKWRCGRFYRRVLAHIIGFSARNA